MYKVVYYARVSTEEEKQLNALKTQCEENEEFIKKQKDWILVDKYIDEGKSATTTQGRYDFERLLNDMQTDKFDIIVIKQIDRGWRNTLDWKIFEHEVYKNKKRLFIRLRNDFYDIEDDGSYIATNMDAMFAEWFSRNLSRKMNQAHKTRMKKGTVVTNGKLWGYNQVNGRLEIDEEQAKIVRYVFNAYVSGKGFRTIKKELDDMGIKNLNGKPFALTTLKRMIKQEKYKGTLICGKRHKNFFTKKYEDVPEEEWIIHENAIPAIIDPEIWEKANKILEGKRKEYGLEDKRKIAGYFNGKYALSGKIKCGKCGRPYYHSKYNTMKYALWECQGYREYGKKHENGCNNVRIYEFEINSIIKEVIFDFWQNKEENINNVIAILNQALTEENDNIELITKLHKDKDRIIKLKNKLLELYADEAITKEEFKIKNDEYNEQLNTIDMQITELENKHKAIMDKKQRLIDIQNTLKTDLSNKDGITDEIIENFVKEIIVYPNRTLTITLDGSKIYQANFNENKYDIVTPFRQNRYSY